MLILISEYVTTDMERFFTIALIHTDTLTIMLMLIIVYVTTAMERFFTIALIAKAIEVLEMAANNSSKKYIKNLSAFN